MLKLNVYGSLLIALMSGMAAMSGSDYATVIAVTGMIAAVMVANDWGIGRGDEN